jgi:hypothetical protein
MASNGNRAASSPRPNGRGGAQNGKRVAKCTFSFDSSGWLYVYHLGVAQYLQKHVLPLMPPDRVAFSGSSGGALVAAALCGGIEIAELTRFVISCQPECQFNPWRMLPCADEAIATFLPDGMHRYNHRLRVLVTRITLRFWRRWAIRPQAVAAWGDRVTLAQTLRASCHIPLLGGMLPYTVRRADGSKLGAFCARARPRTPSHQRSSSHQTRHRHAHQITTHHRHTSATPPHLRHTSATPPHPRPTSTSPSHRHTPPPWRTPGSDDGLFWPSIIYLWRVFDPTDAVLKVT